MCDVAEISSLAEYEEQLALFKEEVQQTLQETLILNQIAFEYEHKKEELITKEKTLYDKLKHLIESKNKLLNSCNNTVNIT